MMKNKRNRIGACLTAALVSVMTLSPSLTALAAQPWSMENGLYVDASGSPIAGALAKGITV